MRILKYEHEIVKTIVRKDCRFFSDFSHKIPMYLNAERTEIYFEMYDKLYPKVNKDTLKVMMSFYSVLLEYS